MEGVAGCKLRPGGPAGPRQSSLRAARGPACPACIMARAQDRPCSRLSAP